MLKALIKSITILSCLLFSVLTVNGQRYNFTSFSIANGLPNNQINKILQDKTGMLWIGTMSGACRFDGKAIIPFDQSNLLSNNPVKTIFQDSKGNMWIGTIRKGFCKYNGTAFKFFTTEQGLLSNIVNAICEDKSGNIWIGTSEGLCRFDGKYFDNYTTSKGLPGNNVSALHLDKNGALWIATVGGGIAVYDGKRFKTYNTANGLSSDVAYSFTEDKDGLIWIGTYQGVSAFDGKKFKNYTLENGLSNEHVEDILCDSYGQVWFCTYGGGFGKLKGDSIVMSVIHEGVNNNIIKSMIEDREGNYWIGSWNGLYKYNGDRFVSYTIDDGLNNNTILSVYADALNNIWFGTLTGGVNMFDGKLFKNYTTNEGLISNTIWSIAQDHNGNYWFGTTNGPSRLKPSDNLMESPFPELANLIIYSILEERNTHQLYFGTDKGVYIYDSKNATLINVDYGLKDKQVRVLFQDEKDVIWIGTIKEIYFLNGNKAISLTSHYNLPNAPVTSIISDGEGSILISTYDFGIVQYKRTNGTPKVLRITKENGLNNERVLFNFLDKQNKLWLGTPQGIDCVDWPTYLNENKIHIYHYDKSNGYLGVESNAACQDTAGFCWFGTVNGAIRFNPDAGHLEGTVPVVTLNNIQLFLSNVNWRKKQIPTSYQTGLPKDLVLPYNKNHLSFIYSGIFHTAPDEVQYRYMLEGFEEEWSPATKINIANYSNIPPGEFTFKVQASANLKDWSVPVTYSFSIKPPIWKTPFFYFLYLVFTVGATLIIYKARTRTLRRSQDVLRRKVDMRTRELSEKNLELAKLSLVASETDNAVMIFDEDLNLEWVNSGYTKLTGYNLNEVKQLKGTQLSQLTTNTLVVENLDECIKEKRSFIYESEIEHKDGRKLWASSTLTPILTDQAKLQKIVVIDTDITLRKKMEEQIRASLEEKGLLLREIHHRVKNNLQIIISLFNLQTNYVEDDTAYKALKEGQDRIRSMALLHERFYQNEGLSKIDFDDYIKRLAENLFQSFKLPPGRIGLKINCEKIALDIDTGVPCGLIINEVVSNSLKHAFKDGREGVIEINFILVDEFTYRLTISDNGMGLAPGFDLATSDSLGIQLIHALSDQIDGKLKIENNNGVKFTIDFKRTI